MRTALILIVSLALCTCSKVPDDKPVEKNPVVISLLGKEFYEPARSQKVQAKLDSNLAVAKAAWEKDPSEENYIWYGRRLGYLSRFQQAIDVFTEGIEKYPESAKLFRHRGHRFISMRIFDRAILDLTRAIQLIPPIPLEIEPDGAPNKLNKPLSTTQFNIRYHLALAYYLKGDFEAAWPAYASCLTTCDNDDLLVATVDWMYMTDMRAGHEERAKSTLGNIHEGMTIIENDSYYKRCLMYQGKLTPESLLEVGENEEDQDLTLATQGYGVGNWYYYHGDTAKAREVFERVVAGRHFGSFGFIAAEAELARWKK
jgi:tetratricopeptide (TPR) repeat protein